MLNKEIIIFGTGIDGLRCMNMLFIQYRMYPEYFVVNHCQQTNFAGYLVKECTRENLNGKYILVATKDWTYKTIYGQLCGLGLVEFEHFIYYEWMFKKLVLLHGNCHLDIIESYLKSSKEFTKRYSIYPNPRICDNKQRTIHKEVLEHIDLWIHQDIQDNNSYGYELSDSYLRKGIKETAVEIVIPNLWRAGKIIFPQSYENKKNASLSNGKDKNGMFPQADFLIDECVEKGLSKEEIVAFCLDENALREEEVKNNFDYYMDKLCLREKQWDIKIVEFIRMWFRKKKLFYDIGHPTNVILKYISSEILKKLEIEEAISSNICLDFHEVPVYPAVRKYLNMEWEEEKIRVSNDDKRIEE